MASPGAPSAFGSGGFSVIAKVALLLLPLLVAGCTTPEEQCRKQHPSDQAAFEACWNAVLQQQNAYLNHLLAESYRSRE